MGEWLDYYKSLLNTNLEGNTHSDLENTKENFCFYFGPNQLESCTEYKYLGVIFNNKGKLNNSAENLSEKACKAYFSLISKIPYSNFISVEKWITLFDSLITPIMTYGSEIWILEFKINFNVIDKLLLEKNKNMIFKNILSNLAIQTELGYYPICIKSYKLMFK